MKNYQTILTWFVTLIAVFGLACEPKPSEVTSIKTVEPAAPTEAETKAAEAEAVKAKAEAEEMEMTKAKAEAEAKTKAEAAEAKAKAEAEEKVRAEAEARAKVEAEAVKAKAEAEAAEAKAKAEAEEKAKAEAKAKTEAEEAEGKVEAKAEVEAKTPAEEPTEIDKTGIAVTVNGVDIAESDVEARVEQQLAQMAKQMPPTLVEKYKPQLRRKVLEGMIAEKLLDEKVKAEEIVVTEEDVITHLKEMGSQQQPPLSLENIKAIIESRGQNFDQTKQQIKKGMSYNKLFEAQFGNQINVTEDDARKYYSENRKQFETSEQVRASHILIKPDTADPNEAKAKAKAKAQDLLKQIEDGADFAELAKANSACSSAANGGDLGFQPRGSWVKPFENAAFALEPGQISDIVETRFGYHIIKVTDHKEAGVITFEQAKDNISNMLKARRQSELATQYIESLKAEANIVYPAGKEPKSSNFNNMPPK